MAKQFIKPTEQIHKIPNIFLGSQAKGFYDKHVKKLEMLTMLPGSYLSNDHDKDSSHFIILESLSSQGYLEKKDTGYIVIRHICGSPSGMAAAVLGRSAQNRVSSYTHLTFADGRNIHEAGERP
ncbi:hypothetical protein SAMN03159341_13116 [Paenibacillus sp. 1_12]|uniref:DUF4357 domain-containing protein n=1 Tax=Paenibacillus sp. 1_12 TaxID=1566278 RepID=UPI0008E067A5|nr:DUF4357 domain-containing protein [Paenibacillus sp. 1_12]SFM40271.1 hypothetical protein SAMN03159341_13116 [Paenibacillus sp. 1_12]